ncbi:MAG TPA: response regulator transcription factor [Solirubrobacter sp.]
MIDVLVADPQPLFRDALARLVHQDRELRLVAELGSGREALAAIRERRPAVALVARDLPGLDGEAVLAAVVFAALPTRVVLLDASPGPEAFALLGAGAAGVLSRDVTPDALRAAVHRVAGGGTALCEDAQAALASELRARHAAERPLLSPREREVLALVAQSLSLPEVAGRLQIAPSTARTHYQHLLAKLEARDRVQLVLHAERRKLLA